MMYRKWHTMAKKMEDQLIDAAREAAEKTVSGEHVAGCLSCVILREDGTLDSFVETPGVTNGAVHDGTALYVAKITVWDMDDEDVDEDLAREEVIDKADMQVQELLEDLEGLASDQEAATREDDYYTQQRLRGIRPGQKNDSR